jgi:hypothetical protein
MAQVMPQFSPYVTIYDKRTNIGHLVYRASLKQFIETGNYTTEKPAGATASENLTASQLPTAGRSQNRVALLEHHKVQTPGLESGIPTSAVVRPEIKPEPKDTNAQEALKEIEAQGTPPKDNAPKRNAPRRRAKQSGETTDS